MGHSDARLRLRIMLLGGVGLLVVTCWILTARPTRPDTYILGLYRARWFCLNVVLTYAAIWLGVMLFRRVSARSLTRIAVLHVGVALGILAFELSSAVGGVNYSRLLGDGSATPDAELRLRRRSRANLRWEGEGVPDLVRKLAIAAETVPTSLRTDSLGLRNPEEKTDPRVVCAGDSVLVARLVPVDEILTERLQRALGAEVMNVSESTYCPQEEMIRVRASVPELGGRLVVQFIFEGNDLTDSKEWRAWCEGGAGSKWPKTGLLWFLLDRFRWPNAGAGPLRRGLFRSEGGTDETVHFLYDGAAVASGMAEMPVLEAALVGAREDLAAEGAGYAVVFLPTKLRVLHAFCTWPDPSILGDPGLWTSPFPEALRRVCEEAGISFFDTTSALVDTAAAGGLPYFAADTHLNSLGHEVLSDALSPWIQGLLAQ